VIAGKVGDDLAAGKHAAQMDKKTRHSDAQMRVTGAKSPAGTTR